jgi:putative ABC transport system permease protein
MVLMGLAMSSAIMMVGNFQQDAVTFMMHAQFNVAQKQDLDITLYEPVSISALSSLRVLPGVEYVEGQRVVPVRLKYQQRSYRTAIQGLSPDSQLQSVLDLDLNAIEIPQQGLMVTEHLADKLGFKVGDSIEIELLEGHRFSRRVTVTHLSQQYMGLGAYMSLESLNRLMREGPAVNKVLLSIEPEYASEIYRRLRDMPAVAGVTLRQTVIDSFYNTLDQILLVFTFINAILGGVIAFGVVYNSVRITLAERGRELASLRVLGYSQGEVAYILLGELALLTLISLPVGFLIGTGLCEFMAENMKSDLYRIPLVLSTYTYAFSALIVILSALFSGLLVLRRLNQLDLVEVLKTRE